MARGCPAMLFTTGRLEAPVPCSSRTNGALSSGRCNPSRYYRTVSLRTEPNSCISLMDEQTNPWALLHAQDEIGRQRCTKPRGRYVRDRLVLKTKTKLSQGTLARDEPVLGLHSYRKGQQKISRRMILRGVYVRYNMVQLRRLPPR